MIQGRYIGLLFLLPMLFYSLGQFLLQGYWVQGQEIAPWQWVLGTGLQIANAGNVVVLAVRIQPWLFPWQRSIGWSYVIARLLEAGFLLASLVLFWGNTAEASTTAGVQSLRVQEAWYHAAMMALGLGSLPLLWALKMNGYLPPWMVYWGWTGYALLATGAAWNWVQQSNALEWSYVGGLFEIFLGVWLLVRGFPIPANKTYLPANLRRMRLSDSG